ncbi:MAG: PorT family protein [bacterium]|nr:PorT family protein [bacterium]
MSTKIHQVSILIPLILLTLLLIVTEVAHAQLDFGAKAGVALADQKFEYEGIELDLDIELRTGIGVGIFVEQPLAPHLGLRLEALYIQKGYQKDFSLTNEFGTILRTDTYHVRVDILSMNYMVSAALASGTYALAGPRLDLNLGVSDDFPGGAFPQALKDEFKSIIAGLTFGLGQDFKFLQRGNLFIEAQYYLDLGKLYKRPPEISEEASLKSIKNRSFALFAGIRL